MNRLLERLDPWLRAPKVAHSTVLYALGTLPALTAMWGMQAHALRQPALLALYQSQRLHAAQSGLTFLIFWLTGLAVLAWHKRRDESGVVRRLGYLSVTPVLFGLTLLWAGHGLRDTPLGITVVASLIVARSLYGLRVVVPSLVLCSAIMLGCEALQWRGLLGASPLLAVPVFTGGPLQDWWALWLRVVYAVSVWPFVTAMIYLFGSLARHHAELESLISTDELTGLFNRREWMARLTLESHRHDRINRPLSVIMIDIDHFKRVNDAHGHPAGDMVLARMGNLIRQNLRQDIDMGARLGGEEFALLLPETDLAGAQTVALKLRDALRESCFEHEGQPFSVTLSAGVAEVVDGQGMAALHLADQHLYRAKALGRDRVVTFPR